jgi:hypothetical protein
MFVRENGDTVRGMVKLKLHTIVNIKDMIYNRASTISPRGDMLLSSGMFKIDARDSLNNVLNVRFGKFFSATINVANNPNDSIFKGRISNTDGNQIVWDEWPNATAKRGQNNTTISGLNAFSWCNLDRYMNETPLTHINVTLPAGFTSANSDVVFKYTGEMSSVFLPANATLKKFSTDGTSYKVVQGRSAKLLAIAKKDDKFFYFLVTIASIGENHSEVITTMTEATEQDFISQNRKFVNHSFYKCKSHLSRPRQMAFFNPNLT